MPHLDLLGQGDLHSAIHLLIAAEQLVHQRFRPMINQFRVRNLIQSNQAARFAEALNEAAEQMRIVPIGLKAVLYFVAAVLAPTLPLALTMVPADKLVERLIKMVL